MPLAQRRTTLALLSFAVALATVVALLLTSGRGVIEAQGQPPPGPVTYTGTITVGGQPAPDGLMVVARIPNPVTMTTSRCRGRGREVRNLIAGPTSTLFNYRLISFHIIAVEGTGSREHLGPEGLTAAEVDTFLPGPNIKDDFAPDVPGDPAGADADACASDADAGAGGHADAGADEHAGADGNAGADEHAGTDEHADARADEHAGADVDAGADSDACADAFAADADRGDGDADGGAGGGADGGAVGAGDVRAGLAAGRVRVAGGAGADRPRVDAPSERRERVRRGGPTPTAWGLGPRDAA